MLRRQLAEETAKPVLRCVHHVLMDNVIAEGNHIFANTPFANSWKIYHDASPSGGKNQRNYTCKIGVLPISSGRRREKQNPKLADTK